MTTTDKAGPPPMDQARAAYCQPECTNWVTHFFGAKIQIQTCMVCGRYNAADVNYQIDLIVQLAKEQERVDNERRRIALKMLSDLDRCMHGRHEGDTCWGCEGGYSLGNPNIRPGQVFGYGLSGMTQYILPERAKRHQAENFVRPTDPELRRA